MPFVKGLKCRECGRPYPKKPLHVCEFCFGPLEVDYRYDKIAKAISKEKIASRAPNMWRYRELLPLDHEPTVGDQVGFTPLVRARRLAKALKVQELYIKNDTVCYPSLSFKDRVVSVAISKALEFGFKVVACASTGNLANSVAANAAAAGLSSFIFIPFDLERSKVIGTLVYGARLVGIRGSYDQVNRLCSEIGGKYHWAFVNITIRPYYAEGSKAFAYEVMEQLGWKMPQHIVVPMAGGSLITKIGKAFKEFVKLGLVEDAKPRIYGAQAAGCSPIVTAIHEKAELFRPVQRPETIAKSLAIGNPADGFYAMGTIRRSNGWAEMATDEEIVEAIRLLAETEGIFTETAGGVTLAVTRKLIRQGRIPRDESIVVSITGNGLKTQEAIDQRVGRVEVIPPTLDDFDKLISTMKK